MSKLPPPLVRNEDSTSMGGMLNEAEMTMTGIRGIGVNNMDGKIDIDVFEWVYV